MRNITHDNITDAVMASFAGASDERFKFLLARLVGHLHAYAREVNLTPEEWKTAIDFLYRAGKISDDGRNEFILTSDVLGMSSLIDLLRAGNQQAWRPAHFHFIVSALGCKTAHDRTVLRRRRVHRPGCRVRRARDAGARRILVER